MVNLVFEEPADNRLVRTDFNEVAAQLRQHPGQYALIAEGLTGSRTQASSLALGVRRGKYAAFKPLGAWMSKSSGDKVWAKFIGEDMEHATEEEKEQVLRFLESERRRLEKKSKPAPADEKGEDPVAALTEEDRSFLTERGWAPESTQEKQPEDVTS